MRTHAKFRRRFRRMVGAALAAVIAVGPAPLAIAAPAASSPDTATPIKHVIVIIGENHSFDNVFATYQPTNGQKVWNLLSEGIVNADGDPGQNFSAAMQNQASDTASDGYSITPTITGPYSLLPQPNTTYAFGQPQNVADSRFPTNLADGPFQITKYVPYPHAFTGDPAHRFFQMWQQVDGGKNDLFTWVAQTVGIGGANTGAGSPVVGNTYQGAVQMGFYNMAQGDAPVFKFIANNYAMSDNYHQAVMGGTGANFFFIGTGDIAYFNNGDGVPIAPPSNQIEDPNATPGTNNFYENDGYSGGSYVDCSDLNAPGVAPIRNYLSNLGIKPNCAPNHYYLLNNYGPGYTAQGTPTTVDATHYNLPPQTVPSIADALAAAGISWTYYIGGWNGGHPNADWCSICNPFQFEKSVMTNPAQRANIQDVSHFFSDVASGNLPSVVFIRPYEPYAGHPADSSLSSYGDFVARVANAVIKNRKLFDQTAIFVTTDEGGGYYDSGYVQPLDFFGDGTRIPFEVISPWVKAGEINHTYNDHASILKFIEDNWNLAPLSGRSRDNLPNPIASPEQPYVPTNGPAIGNLMSMFDFHHLRNQNETPLIIPGGI